MPKANSFSIKGDKRRRHHHWMVKIFYSDNDFFSRVYTDEEKARKFAARQKKSPLVKSTLIRQLS